MVYHCKDCSYRGKVSGQAGECPACGSFNITKRQGDPKQQGATKSSKWRIVLVSLLWGYLFLHIAWKLLN